MSGLQSKLWLLHISLSILLQEDREGRQKWLILTENVLYIALLFINKNIQVGKVGLPEVTQSFE